MPNWKKVIVSGSDATLNSLDVSNSITGSTLQLGNLGAANEILIVGANTQVTSSDLLSIDTANQRLGIGTSTPEVKLDIVGESSGEAQVRVAQHDNTNDGPDIRFFKSHGTAASPTAIANGDYIGAVNAFAYNGSSYLQSGFFGFQADGIDGDTTFGLRTRVDGTLADRIAIDAVGDVNIAENLTVTGDITGSDITIDGWGSVSASLSTIESDITGISGGVITPIQLVVDTKNLSDGNVAWYGISDLQTNPNRAYTTWIAPADGYLDEVVVSPEQTNSTTDNVGLSFMKNAGNQGSVNVAMGAAGTNKTFTFGPGTYSFVKGDRVGLLFGKNTNTADLYNVMVTFRLSN
jgi:hypothetical protein